jgi:hypothetical protein
VRLEAAGGGEDATGPLDRHLHGLVAVDDECLVERVVVVVTDVCLLRNGIKLRSFNQPLNTIGTCPIIYAEGYSAALRFFPALPTYDDEKQLNPSWTWYSDTCDNADGSAGGDNESSQGTIKIPNLTTELCN